MLANGYLLELMEARYKEALKPNNNCTLGNLCSFASEKTAVEEAVLKTYVSTESLVANKGGRQEASGLPSSGKVTKYKAGDTLVSNIRPYFKKIWFAESDGTCSTDVLVFRANEEGMAPLLFFGLYDDDFFAHVVAGSKGTKMPRGDKSQMLTFRMPRFDSSLSAIAEEAGRVLSLVALNRREMDSLAQLRDTLLPKLMAGEIDVSKVELPTPPNSHLYG